MGETRHCEWPEPDCRLRRERIRLADEQTLCFARLKNRYLGLYADSWRFYRLFRSRLDRSVAQGLETFEDLFDRVAKQDDTSAHLLLAGFQSAVKWP